MMVIKPIRFDPSTLTSTNATDTRPAWSVSTTYPLGAVVVSGTRAYESVQAGNIGKLPSLESSAGWWFDAGPSNVYAMFDDQVSTVTTAANSLSVTLATGRVNSSLALINVIGESATVTVTDGGNGAILSTETRQLDSYVMADWYQYFFADFAAPQDMLLFNLPPYASAIVTVTVSGNGPVSVGNLTMGSSYELGGTLSKPTLGADDFSIVSTDEFGTTKLTRRNSTKRVDAQILFKRDQLKNVWRILDGLRATPAIWVLSDRQEDAPLTVYGLRSSFRIVVEYAEHCLVSLELKGMI